MGSSLIEYLINSRVYELSKKNNYNCIEYTAFQNKRDTTSNKKKYILQNREQRESLRVRQRLSSE